MTFKIFTAIALTLAYSVPAFAQGGDDPIGGIDIIVKEDPSLAPVMSGSFNSDELKVLNALKGMDRPAYMAKVGAIYAQEAARGAAPKGGWNAVFQKALVKNWNPEEKGGSTTVRAQTRKQAYKVTFTVQTKGEVKGRPVSKYIGETEKN